MSECYKIWNEYWEERVKSGDLSMRNMFSDEISVKNPDLTAATTTVNIEETSKFPNFKDGVTCTDRQTSETFRFRKPSDVCMPSVSFLIHQLERRTGIRNFSNWKTIGCL